MNNENEKISDEQVKALWNIDPAVSRQFAIDLARLAHSRHFNDIVVLDLGGRSPVARYFVIASGTSSQQVRSVADEMEVTGKKSGNRAYGSAGLQEGRWAVVDFVDVIVHLFDPEFRTFYNLEMLWGDAPKVDWLTGFDAEKYDGFGPGVEIH
ncbi:MAG: ribosome silencing factor [Sedimentisphaerales bacterium]|nr:ribosome silencing factor [Sedimentisphaerales bacterium]MBN2841507.1 ribosome silencing factor [Sedimentisphaerales bacterium]